MEEVVDSIREPSPRFPGEDFLEIVPKCFIESGLEEYPLGEDRGIRDFCIRTSGLLDVRLRRFIPLVEPGYWVVFSSPVFFVKMLSPARLWLSAFGSPPLFQYARADFRPKTKS